MSRVPRDCRGWSLVKEDGLVAVVNRTTQPFIYTILPQPVRVKGALGSCLESKKLGALQPVSVEGKYLFDYFLWLAFLAIVSEVPGSFLTEDGNFF